MRGLAGVAVLAATGGHHESAARLLGAAEGQRERVGLGPFALPERAAYARASETARSRLDAEGFESARAEGRALLAQDAIADAVRVAAEVPATADDRRLDHRKLDPSRITSNTG
jgi:hypothetical protein